MLAAANYGAAQVKIGNRWTRSKLGQSPWTDRSYFLLLRVVRRGAPLEARMAAGCRRFSIPEARRHWQKPVSAWGIIRTEGFDGEFYECARQRRRDRNTFALMMVRKAELIVRDLRAKRKKNTRRRK